MNSFKNSFNEDLLLSVPMRISQEERSSTAKDFVDQLMQMDKQGSKDFLLPFGDSFEVTPKHQTNVLQKKPSQRYLQPAAGSPPPMAGRTTSLNRRVVHGNP